MSTPKCPQKRPYVVSETPGPKAWCSCGASANQPYCDGSHKGTDFHPVKVNVEKAGPVAWCGCKQSKKGALCDGSHSQL